MAYYKHTYICSPDKELSSNSFYRKLAAYMDEFRIDHSAPSSFHDIASAPYIAVCLIDAAAAQPSQWKGYVSAFRAANDDAAVILYCPDGKLPQSMAKNAYLGSLPCCMDLDSCLALVRKTAARKNPLPNPFKIQEEARRKNIEEADRVRKEKEREEALAKAQRQSERMSDTVQEQAKALDSLKQAVAKQQQNAEKLKHALREAHSTVADLEEQLQRPRVSFTGVFFLFSLDLLLLLTANFQSAGLFGQIRQHLYPILPEVLWGELMNALLIPMAALAVLHVALVRDMTGGRTLTILALVASILSALVSIEQVGYPCLTQNAPVFMKGAMLWSIFRSALLIVAAWRSAEGSKE